MEKQEILKQFPKQEDKLLISKIIDKLKFVNNKNQIQYTDFLDTYQQSIVIKALSLIGENKYVLDGGYDEAERKILFMYPEKLKDIFLSEDLNEEYNENINQNSNLKENNTVINQNVKVISIILPQDLQGTYHHSEYLGGIMKLGIKREKIGDIIVNETGADILVLDEMADYLKLHLQDLTRFQKAEILIKEISELTILPVKKEEITFTDYPEWTMCKTIGLKN